MVVKKRWVAAFCGRDFARMSGWCAGIIFFPDWENQVDGELLKGALRIDLHINPFWVEVSTK
jgi:hypothetical protein